MTQRTRKTEKSVATLSSTEPLLIAPSLIIDQDVSFGSTRLKRSLQTLGHYVIHVQDRDLHEKTSDTAVAQEALFSNAAVVTSDKTFPKSVASNAGRLPDLTIIIGPKLRKGPEVSDTIARLAHLIDRDVRSTTIPGYKTVVFVYQHRGDFVSHRLCIPALILQLLPILEARENAGLSTKELAARWKCPESTAWKRAEQFAQEGWLRKERRGRRAFYARSPLLARCLDGQTTAIREAFS